MKEKERLENFSPIGCDADGNVAEKAERYEKAIEEALELMEYGGPRTRSKVKYVLEQALEGDK